MSKKELKEIKLSTEAYKGVRDFYPEEQAVLQHLFQVYRRVLERFGYVEYHASILEPSELYKTKGAENEELVNEQTYTFIDRGGREVTLRPEMTPSVARMVAGKRRDLGFPLRFYSIPNVFRYERPQRGRLREHWQLNIDIFGSTSLAADAEVMAASHAIMLELGAKQEDFEIRIGSRGFLDGLVKNLGLSDKDSKKLFGLLDRRAKMPGAEFASEVGALGVSLDALSPSNQPADVVEVTALLEQAGITNAMFDPSIVRGFNYYTGVVFEIFDTHPDNNRSIFGGGRYNGLVSLFDDEQIAAVGAAAGDTALTNFLEVRGLLPAYEAPTHLYIAVASPSVVSEAFKLASELRTAGVSVAVDFGDKKLSDQIKAASKHKIPYLTVVGEDELKSGTFKVRDLVSGEEDEMRRAELPKHFQK